MGPPTGDKDNQRAEMVRAYTGPPRARVAYLLHDAAQMHARGRKPLQNIYTLLLFRRQLCLLGMSRLASNNAPGVASPLLSGA